jgi:hypothetical protein
LDRTQEILISVKQDNLNEYKKFCDYIENGDYKDNIINKDKIIDESTNINIFKDVGDPHLAF